MPSDHFTICPTQNLAHVQLQRGVDGERLPLSPWVMQRLCRAVGIPVMALPLVPGAPEALGRPIADPVEKEVLAGSEFAAKRRQDACAA